MRPVTVFVLLLFAGGVVWGDPAARALVVQSSHVIRETGALGSKRARDQEVASAATRGAQARRLTLPVPAHRRAVRQGRLPAPRAPDRRPGIA